MLIKAIFIRTMTTDRPEAVQIAFDNLSQGFCECIAIISKVGTGFDYQSQRNDEASVSLDLILGGKVILYRCLRRHHH